MIKPVFILLASVFATGVYAQAVTTKPGDSMGPTRGTEATTSSGASASKGTPIKGDQTSGPAVTTRAGDAMGPTESTNSSKHDSKTSHSKSSTYRSNDKGGAAVTTEPGGAMGPTGSNTSSGSRK